MKIDLLSLHQIESTSLVNGPGVRFVLWFQGCTLNCPGCFNPATHPICGGQIWTINRLCQEIMAVQDSIEGITLSGGEPLQQLPALVKFLDQIHRDTHLSVILLTGYNWNVIQEMPDKATLLSHIDVVIAGPYRDELRVAHHLIGSANKTVHFITDRYTMANFLEIPECEVILTPDGEVILSGIDPITWQD